VSHALWYLPAEEHGGAAEVAHRVLLPADHAEAGGLELQQRLGQLQRGPVAGA
jgi:hypothetical protein